MITILSIAGFGAAAMAAGFRLVVGPTVVDRVLALDVALVALIGALTVWSAGRDEALALDLAVVLAVVGFAATIAASRIIDRAGSWR